MALSTYSEYQALSASEKLVLATIEASQRLMGWTLYSGSVYTVSFSYSVISSIEENGTTLTSVGSIGAVVASSYFHDRDNGLIYLRASDSTNPNGKVEVCTFKLFFANGPVRAPHDLSTGFDVEWIHLVKETSEFGVELDNYNQFGLAIEGSGNIRLINDQSYWASRFDKLTFENQRVSIYSWNRDLPITEAKLIYKGRIVSKTWGPERIAFELKDTFNELRAPVTLNDLSSLSGARLIPSFSTLKQRLLYGKPQGVRGINYDHVMNGYPITGTLNSTNASTAVSGTGTAFLTQLSPNDQIQIGSSFVRGTIASITDDTNLVLTQNYGGPTQVGVTAIVNPSHSKRYTNRKFSIAGHALREPSTTVVSAPGPQQFTVSDATDIEAGDDILVNSEASVVELVSGNIIRLTGALSFTPSVGHVVLRPAISEVFIEDRELTRTRDYTYTASAGTLLLNNLAEFNIAPELKLTGTSVTFTNTSRAITGIGTHFKKDLSPTTWIKANGQSDWFEVLSIESDTALTLRTAATYTSTSTSNLYRDPLIYKEGTTVLSCSALGVTTNGLTTGALLKTAGGIAKDLLTRAGLSSILNTASFTASDIDNQFTLGMVVPKEYNQRSIPNYRDTIERVNKSVFGSLVQNEDFQLEYIILSPERLSSATKLEELDILNFAVTSQSDKIAKTANIQYLFKEYDPDADDNSFAVSSADSDDGEFLAKTNNEFTMETAIISASDAATYASRWAFVLGVATSIVKIKTKLQIARLQVTDKVELLHEKLYERYGSTDTRKIALMRFVKQNGLDVNAEMEDLGNAFSRVAIITLNTAVDFSSADTRTRAYNGYITDTYGMQSNDAETFGTNLIW